MRIRKVSLGAALALLAFTNSVVPLPAAAPTTYVIGKEAFPSFAHVRFTIMKWMVFQEEGGFRDAFGSLVFDPRHPDASRVDIVIQSASIDTNNAGRGRVLRSDDFFDVEKFPTLEFHSIKVSPHGANQLDVTGNLTIHGVTRTITISARTLGTNVVPQVGELVGFETTYTIDRTDYGVMGTKWSGGKLMLSKEVGVSIRLGGVHRN